eukprot:306638_1
MMGRKSRKKWIKQKNSKKHTTYQPHLNPEQIEIMEAPDAKDRLNANCIVIRCSNIILCRGCNCSSNECISSGDAMVYSYEECVHNRQNVCLRILNQRLQTNSHWMIQLPPESKNDVIRWRITNMFAYDLFLNTNKLQYLLKLLPQVKYKKNVSLLIHIIFANRLMVKYLLCQTELWKELYLYLTLKLNVKYNWPTDKHFNLLITYWSTQHIHFAMANNLISVLICNIKIKLKNHMEYQLEENKPFLKSDKAVIRKLQTLLFDVIYVCFQIRNISKLNDNSKTWNTFKMLFMLELKKLYRIYNRRNKYLLKYFVKNAFKSILNSRRYMNFWKDYPRCQWIHCNKEGKYLSYQCKGCQFVRYCSRKHQKKDWKMIHSQQCLRIK